MSKKGRRETERPTERKIENKSAYERLYLVYNLINMFGC